MSEAATLCSRWARRLLIAVVVVAMLEWVASALAYRRTIAPPDWEAAAAALAELPPEEPVWLGTPWLAPRARMHLPRLARWDAVAPPDLRGAPRFHVLGRAGAAWSSSLRDDLEDLPDPTLVEERPLGGLALYTYEQPAAGAVQADFVAEPRRLEVSSPRGRCKGAGPWRCEEGQVRRAALEIGLRPRRCLQLDVSDGATVRLLYPQMPTGTVLRGHLGFGDFNARLRSDAPARLRLSIDGELAAQWLVSDAQGWWPFAVATEAGTHDVELAVTPATRGTWHKGGYDGGRAHRTCVELRSLTEGDR